MIKACYDYELVDIMGSRYDSQFHATYYWDQGNDEVHWMTDGRHYKIDFLTFCWINRIHNVRRLEQFEVSFIYEEQNLAVPNWSRTKLKIYYNILHNLFHYTLCPKDNVTDLNGYITNLLSRFPDGESFNVPRFIWVELAYAMDDGRRSLPYAPYLMYMIERVTGMKFPKDCIHLVYKIKKKHGGTRGTSGSKAAADQPTRDASIDIPEPSRARKQKKRSRWLKMSAWMKTILGHCMYASQTAYEDRLERRKIVRAAREVEGLPPLPPVRPPP